MTNQEKEAYLAKYEELCNEIKKKKKELILKQIFIRRHNLFGVFGSMICSEDQRTRESFDLKAAKATLSAFLLNKIGHLIKITPYKQLSVRTMSLPTSAEREEEVA